MQTGCKPGKDERHPFPAKTALSTAHTNRCLPYVPVAKSHLSSAASVIQLCPEVLHWRGPAALVCDHVVARQRDATLLHGGKEQQPLWLACKYHGLIRRAPQVTLIYASGQRLCRGHQGGGGMDVEWRGRGTQQLLAAARQQPAAAQAVSKQAGRQEHACRQASSRASKHACKRLAGWLGACWQPGRKLVEVYCLSGELVNWRQDQGQEHRGRARHDKVKLVVHARSQPASLPTTGPHSCLLKGTCLFCGFPAHLPHAPLCHLACSCACMRACPSTPPQSPSNSHPSACQAATRQAPPP